MIVYEGSCELQTWLWRNFLQFYQSRIYLIFRSRTETKYKEKFMSFPLHLLNLYVPGLMFYGLLITCLLWPPKKRITCLLDHTYSEINFVYFRRELEEELGIVLPKDAFELLFIFLQEWLVTLTSISATVSFPSEDASTRLDNFKILYLFLFMSMDWGIFSCFKL